MKVVAAVYSTMLWLVVLVILLTGCAFVSVEKDGEAVNVSTKTFGKSVQGFTLDKEADGSVRLELESSNPTVNPTADMVCAMKLAKGEDCD
jgi:hypothetical protein